MRGSLKIGWFDKLKNRLFWALNCLKRGLLHLKEVWKEQGHSLISRASGCKIPRLGVQNPRPREISWASGDVFPNTPLLSAVYGYNTHVQHVNIMFVFNIHIIHKCRSSESQSQEKQHVYMWRQCFHILPLVPANDVPLCRFCPPAACEVFM